MSNKKKYPFKGGKLVIILYEDDNSKEARLVRNMFNSKRKKK